MDVWPADPFTWTDPKFNQVVPWSLHTFPENFMQIGLVMLLTKKERNKQRKKETKKLPENNTPSPYWGRGKNILHRVSTTVQICFCQNLGKFQPILIIFDR